MDLTLQLAYQEFSALELEILSQVLVEPSLDLGTGDGEVFQHDLSKQGLNFHIRS